MVFYTNHQQIVEGVDYYYKLIITKLNLWVNAFVDNIPNIIASILVLALFIFLSSLVNKIVKKLVIKLSNSPALIKLIPLLARWGTLIMGILICLNILNLEKVVFSLLAGAGIFGIAMGFAFQDLAANFIAGFYLSIMQPFKVGDAIKTGEYLGRVQELNFRNTVLITSEGQIVSIPNRMIFEKPLINYNVTGKRRISIVIGIDYKHDLDQVSKIIHDALNKLDYILKTEETVVASDVFTDLTINFNIQFWVSFPSSDISFAMARDGAIKAIKHALDEEGIEISGHTSPSSKVKTNSIQMQQATLNKPTV